MAIAIAPEETHNHRWVKIHLLHITDSLLGRPASADGSRHMPSASPLTGLPPLELGEGRHDVDDHLARRTQNGHGRRSIKCTEWWLRSTLSLSCRRNEHHRESRCGSDRAIRPWHPAGIRPTLGLRECASEGR